MSKAQNNPTSCDPDVDEENTEVATGQRAEASKDMKNITVANDEDPVATSSVASSKVGVPKSNFVLESLYTFKEDVVKRKVEAAIKKRDFDKVSVDPGNVQIIADELDITHAQATQLLKKFNGDPKRALSHFIAAKPCTINELISY